MWLSQSTERRPIWFELFRMIALERNPSANSMLWIDPSESATKSRFFETCTATPRNKKRNDVKKLLIFYLTGNNIAEVRLRFTYVNLKLPVISTGDAVWNAATGTSRMLSPCFRTCHRVAIKRWGSGVGNTGINKEIILAVDIRKADVFSRRSWKVKEGIWRGVMFYRPDVR